MRTPDPKPYVCELRKGIHVAHIIVDGPVDAPDTLGKMMGAERFAELRSTAGAHDACLPSLVMTP